MSGPHQKFCDGIVAGLKKGAAYRAAYPQTTAAAAGPSATALLKNPKIKAEIARQRAVAESLPGSAPLTLAEKRNTLAAVVRSKKAELDGCEIRIADKLAAIKLDNDLAGEGSESEANDALAALLGRVSK